MYIKNDLLLAKIIVINKIFKVYLICLSVNIMIHEIKINFPGTTRTWFENNEQNLDL